MKHFDQMIELWCCCCSLISLSIFKEEVFNVFQDKEPRDIEQRPWYKMCQRA